MLIAPCAAEPQAGLADDDTENVFVRAVITVLDPLFYVVSMVPVIVVSVAVVTIMTGVNPVPFAIEVAVDLCPFGPETVGLMILALCLGTVCLVLEAVLDPVALAIQVPLNSFPF